MAKNKTTETAYSVAEFLTTINDEKKRKDCTEIINLVTQHTGIEPKMWGASIVGFVSYHYKYDSGHEGHAPLAGLAARVNAIVFYLSTNLENREELLQRLGKQTGKGCIYIQKIEDIDKSILIRMFENAIAHKKQSQIT